LSLIFHFLSAKFFIAVGDSALNLTHFILLETFLTNIFKNILRHHVVKHMPLLEEKLKYCVPEVLDKRKEGDEVGGGEVRGEDHRLVFH
jgi:hypothetical protein